MKKTGTSARHDHWTTVLRVPKQLRFAESLQRLSEALTRRQIFLELKTLCLKLLSWVSPIPSDWVHHRMHSLLVLIVVMWSLFLFCVNIKCIMLLFLTKGCRKPFYVGRNLSKLDNNLVILKCPILIGHFEASNVIGYIVSYYICIRIPVESTYWYYRMYNISAHIHSFHIHVLCGFTCRQDLHVSKTLQIA